GIMEQVAVWLERSGLEKAKGQAYISPLFASLAQKANSPCNEPFSALSREFATKGGLNEQVFSDIEKRCDSGIRRIDGGDALPACDEG
ncbi:pyrroline-5-carboxylate reductase, partial [Rhizobium ruizarguesonis]